MNLSIQVKSNTNYILTFENVDTLKYLYRNSWEGRLQKGAYRLSKNFPIKDYKIKDNVSNSDYKNLVLITGEVSNYHSLQDMVDYIIEEGNTFGIELNLVDYEVVSKEGLPDMDSWWEDMVDNIPEGLSDSYKELKWLLILLIALYVLNIFSDVTDIFKN